MTSVYIVSAGDYSDYRILRVFMKLEAAREYAYELAPAGQTISGEPVYIETHETHETDDNQTLVKVNIEEIIKEDQ